MPFIQCYLKLDYLRDVEPSWLDTLSKVKRQIRNKAMYVFSTIILMESQLK